MRFSANLWLAAPLLMLGCAPTVTGAAKARAVVDLSCPKEQIGTYRAVGGSVVARDCGAWTEYACFYSRGEPVCLPEPRAQIIQDRPQR